MNNKQWINGITVVCLVLTASANANQYPSTHHTQGALSWWEERSTLGSGNYQLPPPGQIPSLPQQQRYQTYAPPLIQPQTYIPQVQYQPTAYRHPGNTHNQNSAVLKCENLKQLRQPERCISRVSANLTGLHEQIRYLNSEPRRKNAISHLGNISNTALLETAKALLSREKGRTLKSFQQSFSLYEVGSDKKADSGYFTGYFTPEIQVKNHPDQQYKYPIYAPPPGGTHLSRSQIDSGALKNRRLEIAWTNAPVHLYFAQIQGSAIARYPDGRTRYLSFAGHNNHSHRKISHYLKKKGYLRSGLSNTKIRRWLHQNPDKINEVLHQNPRYIFFSFSDNIARTATGTTIIPGHTVAVDDRYIPLGSVLLAEIPRINHQGKRTGSDWRMLFAQDRGDAIKGPGRLDLYTGSGQSAEQKTYQLTGLHKTYLLVRKPGWNNPNAFDM